MKTQTQHLFTACAALSAALLFAILACAQPVFAIDETDMTVLQVRIDETQQEVERTAEEYNDASERATAARAAAEAAREEVARLEAQISESQATLDRVGRDQFAKKILEVYHG